VTKGAFKVTTHPQERDLPHERSQKAPSVPAAASEIDDMDPSDARLMAATAGGDHDAFAQLVKRHQKRVWHLAYRSLGDAREAEDVSQDAFLRVFRAAARYRPSARFTTYLHSIVTRLCIDRTRKRRPLLSDHIDEIPTTDSPVATLERAERKRRVQQAILELPVKQRLAVVMRYEQDMSHREIAQAMQTTPKSIERLLARARLALAPRLSDLADAE